MAAARAEVFVLWRRSARRTDEGDGGVATKGGEQAGGMVDGVLGHEAHRAGAQPGCSGLVRVCAVWPGREEDKVRDLGEEEKVSGTRGVGGKRLGEAGGDLGEDWAVGFCWIERSRTVIRVNKVSANQKTATLCRVLRFGTRQRVFVFSLFLYVIFCVIFFVCFIERG